MTEISHFGTVGFMLTTLATIWLLFKALKIKKYLLLIILWMLIVSILGLSGFYRNVDAFPPRFVFLLGPGILIVLIIFLSKRGKEVMDTLNLKWLTLLHTVRVPVEIVLYGMFLEGLIPYLMTFEGYNFDILSGITAPIIYYFTFIKKRIDYKGLLLWNFICLGLLINVLTIAALSAQTPFQKFAFEQPNIGVIYFPFVWLPAIIVPIVLFSHLASIKQLLSLKKRKGINNE